jgi:hypothetical protein
MPASTLVGRVPTVVAVARRRQLYDSCLVGTWLVTLERGPPAVVVEYDHVHDVIIDEGS